MLTPGWKEALIKGEALTYSIKYDFSLVEGYYDTEKKGYIDLISKATQLQHDMRIMRGGKHTTWTRVNVMVRDLRPEEGIIDMVCVNYDITKLKETEFKLIGAKEFLAYYSKNKSLE